MTATLEVLLDEACDPLYEAVVECTEEAIVNALCMADEMRGQSDHFAPALPLDRLARDPAPVPRAAHGARRLRRPPCASASSSPTSARSRPTFSRHLPGLAAHRRGHDVRFVSVDDLSFLDDNNILATTTRVRAGDYARPGRLRAGARLRRGGRRGGHAGRLRRGLPALQPDARGRRTRRRAAHRLRLAAAPRRHAGGQRSGGAAPRRQPHVPGRLPRRRPHPHAGVALEAAPQGLPAGARRAGGAASRWRRAAASTSSTCAAARSRT